MFKKIILSILSGLLLFLSWPPIDNFTFLIFISFVPLLIIESSLKDEKSTFKKLFFYVYLAFFIFNLCTTFWIWHAHSVGAVFAILCNSFFMTFVFCIYSKIKKTSIWNATFFILPVLWIGFEYLHLNWDLSWPWLTLGNVFSTHTEWIQWYSFTGVLGGTIWIFLVNFLFLKLYQNKSNLYLRNRYLSTVILSIFLPIGLSQFMYHKNNNMILNDTVNVLVVQPNIDVATQKFSISQEDQINLVLDSMYAKTDSLLDFVILPETFLISGIWEHEIKKNKHIARFKRLIDQFPNLNIIVGSTIYELSEKSAISKPLRNHVNQYYKVHNSAIQLNSFGISTYHKSKLVPGAEQMPFQKFLYPILGDNILQIGNSNSIGNFAKQDAASVFLSSKQHKSAPIICYESIYGDYVRNFINKGAQIIFIITNDGWWKKTSGYQQHNLYAKLRAIETRRYVARSANTGISSIINPFGELEDNIGWGKRGVIQYKIPLYNDITFYVKYGDFIGRLSALFSVLILLYFFVANKLHFYKK